MTRPAADFLRSIGLPAWADDPMTLAGTERIIAALREVTPEMIIKVERGLDDDWKNRTVKGIYQAMLAARVGTETRHLSDPSRLSEAFGRHVVGCCVPGTDANGRQRIKVTFADSGSVEVESDSIEGAWRALYEEAREMLAARVGEG